MISRKSHVIVTLAIVVLIADETSSQQVSCDNSTRYLERGKRAVISCEYSSSFIAVFWYRGQTSSPFLRLEQGKHTTENGFDISSSGNMIIENVEISHGGFYRISVIDSNADPSSGTVNIYVTVPLKNGLQLESCATSQQSLCQEISEEQRALYLVCSATDTRPEVDFVWSKMSSNGRVNVDQFQFNASVNSSTELIKSSSILKHEKDEFSLQYFICTASGPAATGTPETGIFVEGDKEVTKQMTKTETRSIQQGEDLQIRCSTERFILSKWTILYPNKTMKLLREFYPGEEGGPCLFGFGCNVNDEGALSFETISYLHEGSYICTYARGDTARRSITDVSVIITPNPEKIIIEGCGDINDCNRNVGLTGTLQVSVTGARPPVKVICVVTKEEESGGYIFGDKNEISPLDTGTFDTEYSVEYSIEECSEPVSVTCSLLEDSVFTNLSPSHVNLVTNKSNCRGRPGTIAFVIILTIGIVVALIISAVTCHKRKKRRGQDNQQIRNQHEFKDGRQQSNKEDIEENLLNGEREQGEGAVVELESEIIDENADKLVSNQYLDAFQSFYENLKENEKVSDELFKDVMNVPQKCKENISSSNFLVNHMIQVNCEKEMLSIVIQYLAELTQQEQEWVPIIDFCKLLEELTLSDKLSPGISFTLFRAILRKKQISLATYVGVTGKLLKLGKFDEITIMTNLKDLLLKGQINKMELVDNVLLYMTSFKLSKRVVLEEAKQLDNEVPLRLYLQATHTLYKSGCKENMILDLFDDIVKAIFKSHHRKVTLQNVSDKEKDISCIYIQVLLFGIVEGKIALEDATGMLNSDMKNTKLTSSKNGFGNTNVLLGECKTAYERSMNNERVQVFKDFRKDITRSYCQLLKEVFPFDDFIEETSNMIRSKQLEDEFWIAFIVDLWKNGQVDEEVYKKLSLEVAESYAISRDDYKKILDGMTTDKAERRLFHRPIQFNKEGKQGVKDKKTKDKRQLKD